MRYSLAPRGRCSPDPIAPSRQSAMCPCTDDAWGSPRSLSLHSTCLWLRHCVEECCQRPCQLCVLVLVYLIQSGSCLYGFHQVPESFHAIGRLLNVHLHCIEDAIQFSE